MKKVNLKPAFVDQIVFWFLLIAISIGVVGTVVDVEDAKAKYINIEKITTVAAKAAAKYYMMHGENMTEAQNIANTVIYEGKLGKELVDNQHLYYIWRDLDSDGSPDAVTAYVTGYVQSNFWYKFFDLQQFDLPQADFSAYCTKDMSEFVSWEMRFGGSNAGYHNIIGTYELDENGCFSNPKLLLVNKENWNIGDVLGTYTNMDTRFFIIPDGYDTFGSRSADLDSFISITGCDPNVPSVTIDGNTDSGDVYFQDTIFNTDNGYDHMREIGKSYHDDYLDFINTPIVTGTESYCVRYRRGRCREWGTRDTTREATWEDWETHAQNNNIDYENDPNDEYIIAMEDLPNGGDKDFNDILLDTTKIRVPGIADLDEIEDGDDVSPSP